MYVVEVYVLKCSQEIAIPQSSSVTINQGSHYLLTTSPMAIIWSMGRLKLVSGEIFDYLLPVLDKITCNTKITWFLPDISSKGTVTISIYKMILDNCWNSTFFAGSVQFQ